MVSKAALKSSDMSKVGLPASAVLLCASNYSFSASTILHSNSKGQSMYIIKTVIPGFIPFPPVILGS